MSKYRFKTREEFIRDDLWYEENNCPYDWAYNGEMNEYLGKDVPDEYTVYCDENETFTYDGWMFRNKDYTLKEQQEYFDDLSQHIGRYIRALVDNPNSGSKVKNGDIGKIISSNRADFPNRKGYSCTCALDKNNLGIKYELLPEDYSPEQEVKEPNIEFIPGKWYKYNRWYIKYKEHVNDIWRSSEQIDSCKKYSQQEGSFGDRDSDDKKILLIDLSEIQEYLPEGHPDKVKAIDLKVGKWYSFNWDYFGKDRIVIAKIKEVTEKDFIISWRSYLWNDNDYNDSDGYFFKDISNIKELSIEEVQPYLPNGHPDKITNQKFEIGKWYKWYQKNHGKYHYGKVERINLETDTLVMSPWIIGCTDYNYSGYFDLSKAEQIQEISVEEVQEFLPKNHSDKITSDEFKKGEYIVLTDKFDGYSKDFISNHIYKQRKDSTYLQPKYDSLNSTTNGWTKYTRNNPNNWRYATQEEIDEYERRGKPYDVTELNKQSFPDEGSIEIKHFPENLIRYLEKNDRKTTSNDSSYNKQKVIFAWNKSTYWFCSVGSSKPKYSKDFIEKIIGKSIYLNTILEAKKELSMKEIQEECKRRFPIGCTFIAVGSCMHRILEEDSLTYSIVGKQIWAHDCAGWLYGDGKWAELISLPEENIIGIHDEVGQYPLTSSEYWKNIPKFVEQEFDIYGPTPDIE